MRTWSATRVLLAGTGGALTGFMLLGLAGCGDGGDDDVKRAAEPAVVRKATEDLRAVQPPAWGDVAVSRPTLQSIAVVKQRAGRRVSGTVRAQLKLTPKPDKAPFVRVLDKTGATTTVTRRFTADVVKAGDHWQVSAASVRIQAAPRPAPSSAAREQARTRTLDAVKALLTWPGRLDAYNRAQRSFYASRLATEADFNQPGFDPAPALTLNSNKTGSKGFGAGDVPVGAAWERTNDNAQDDQPLAEVLADAKISCERFVIKVLRPKTVSGQPDTSQQPESSELAQTVAISGQAIVHAGVWQNKSPYSNCGKARTAGTGRTVTAPPRDVTVKYTARVSRLLLGPDRSWFITTLQLQSPFATSNGATGPYSIDG